MTTNSLNELISLMAEKALLLETVRERLKDEQQCIMAGSPVALDAATREVEQSFSRLIAANDRFSSLLSVAASEMGLTADSNLTSVIRNVDPESGMQLRKLQDRCFSVADAISATLGMNEALLRNSLEIVGRSLSLFSNLLGGGETYGAAGRLSSGKAAPGVLYREI